MTALIKTSHLSNSVKRNFNFCPEERIHLYREIQKILDNGHRVSEGALVLFWLERNKEEVDSLLQMKKGRASTCRFAMRLQKGFPSAVVRNRMKRIFREIFRKEKWQICPYTDLVLITKKELKEFKYDKMKEAFISLCNKAGIWNG